MDHEFFMKKALALAKKGQGYTSPNPMVGAVIVKDGEVKGKGYHQVVGQAHAEVNAIADAGTRGQRRHAVCKFGALQSHRQNASLHPQNYLKRVLSASWWP